MSLLDRLADLLSGGRQRRLQRALNNLEATFGRSTLEGEALDRAAGVYGRALRLALRVDPLRALSLLRAYDRLIPADRYGLVLQRSSEPWLFDLARRDDVAVLTVALDVATRLGLGAVQREAGRRGAG